MRSERISFKTKLVGTLVGKGPAVSEGVTLQSEAELPLVEPFAMPVAGSMAGSILED